MPHFEVFWKKPTLIGISSRNSCLGSKFQILYANLPSKLVLCSCELFWNFGWLLASWDPNIFTLVPSLTVGGLLLTGTCLSNNMEIALLNFYGSCVDKRRFWNLVADSRLLSIKNLILAGDLNITLASDETWGEGAVVGSSNDYYKLFFQNKSLIDIEPVKVVPTWRNGRLGTNAIWKRLDRFLVSEDLLIKY
jgi:hypothetical protein